MGGWSGGVYSRFRNWVTDKANSINPQASLFDQEDDGFAAGLNNCVTKDGLNKPSSAMDWNGQNLTGVLALTATGAINFSGSGAGSWAGTYTFPKALSTGGNAPDSPIIIKSATPGLSMVNSGAPANQQAWTLFLGNADLIWRLDNDAGSVNKTFLDVNRSTNSVVSMTFGNSTDNNSFSFAGTGLVKAGDQSGTQFDLGWRDAPNNTKTGNYGLILSDRGKQIFMNGSGLTLTIPAEGSINFPLGTVIQVAGGGGGANSIAITTDNLFLAGVGTTGTRTIAAFGLATLTKVASQTWFIAGAGVT
jgi:hypothetical protein